MAREMNSPELYLKRIHIDTWCECLIRDAGIIARVIRRPTAFVYRVLEWPARTCVVFDTHREAETTRPDLTSRGSTPKGAFTVTTMANQASQDWAQILFLSICKGHHIPVPSTPSLRPNTEETSSIPFSRRADR